MTPEKAYSLGARSENMEIISQPDKFGGEWRVFIPSDEAHRPHGHVLWTGDVYGACHFRAAVERLEKSQA